MSVALVPGAQATLKRSRNLITRQVIFPPRKWGSKKGSPNQVALSLFLTHERPLLGHLLERTYRILTLPSVIRED